MNRPLLLMGTWHKVFLVSATLLLVEIAFGQEPSLGDVARQQRRKQASRPNTVSVKVVTNEDMPERADAGEDSSRPSDTEKGEEPKKQSSSGTSEPRKGESAEQWKAKILAQKTLVQAQQQQVERLRDSIHFVEANRYVNGVQYNEQQRRKQIQLGQMESQLEQQKKKLADMQEAARRAGFGNSVYDPNE